MAVVDASVAAALILQLPWSASARTALAGEERLLAPDVFLAEIANTIWRSVRAGHLLEARALPALQTMLALVEIRSDARLVETALRTALRYGHPVYDCLYVALAGSEGDVLLTADRKLVSIARAAGVAAQFFAK